MTFRLSNGTIISDIARVSLRGWRERIVLLRNNPSPQCTNCGGTGQLWFAALNESKYVSPDGGKIPYLFYEGHFRTYESLFFDCPICRANNVDRIKSLWLNSGLEKEEREYSLGFLDGRAGKESALREAQELLSLTPYPSGWLSLYGAYGVGKSGVLKSLVAAFIRAGVSARYIRAMDVLGEARETYGDESAESEAEMVSRYSHYSFLAVDEVDRVSGTEWARAMLFNVLDDRYKKRGEIATAIATNSLPDSMPPAFGYLNDRMKDGARAILAGESLRGIA